MLRSVAACLLLPALLAAQSPAASPSLASLALADLDAVRDSMPLGRWRTLHPGDAVVRHPGRDLSDGADPWCATATAVIPIGGGDTLRRTAFFHPPEPPAVLVPLPTDSVPRLVETCQLRMLGLTIERADTGRIQQLGVEALTALAGILGTNWTVEVPHVGRLWLGAGRSGVATWQRGPLTVATTVDRRSWEERQPGRLPMAVVTVRTIDSRTYPFRSLQVARGGDPAEWSTVGMRLVDRAAEAAVLAGIGGAPGEAFINAIARRRRGTFESTPPDSVAGRQWTQAIVAWVRASDSLDRNRRAAALMAADLLFGSTAGHWNAVGAAALRRPLEEAGARFVHRHLGYGDYSVNAWLDSAIRLQPTGRTAELLLLTELEQAPYLHGGCDARGFEKVIARGEPYLARHPGSSVALDVHLALARAWGDIVLIAMGGEYGGPGAERARYLGRGGDARRFALERYAHVVRNDPDGPRGRAAWIESWRLRAGLAPIRKHFWCIDD